MAVAFASLVQTNSTLNVATYISGLFTPTAGDWLLAIVTASGTVAAGTMTDSQSLGFSQINRIEYAGNSRTIYMFCANALAAATLMTVTFDCTGDDATGCTIIVIGVTGQDGTSITAVRQTDARIGLAGAPPACSMPDVFKTVNAGIGFAANQAATAALTPPASWNETHDTGFATPNTGTEVVNRVSGETGSTITWGANSLSGWGAIVAEIHTSPAERPFYYNEFTASQ